MKLCQDDVNKIIMIQSNIRGFLVRQEIRRQLLEIYEYEKEHLEYLQGQQFNKSDYYNQQYGLDYNKEQDENGDEEEEQDDDEEEDIQQFVRQSQRDENAKYSATNQNLKENVKKQKSQLNQEDNHFDDDQEDEDIEFHQSSNCSSSVEIEKKVSQKYLQQQIQLKEKQQENEYQLFGKYTYQQKINPSPADAPSKQSTKVCLATGKNEAEALKFPHVSPIFSNSQMKQLLSNRELNNENDHDNIAKNINENKEKLKNIAQKLKKEEEDIESLSEENLKIRLYSQSANIIRNADGNEDESIQEEDKQNLQQEMEINQGMPQQKYNEYNKQIFRQHQEQNYKENEALNQDYLNKKSVNISVEITESNLLTEQRHNLQPISNYTHQNNNNKQKMSAKQSNNTDQSNHYNQMKTNPNNNKINQNRFYQEEEDSFYAHQQQNLYKKSQKLNQEKQINQMKNGGKYTVNKDQSSMIQVIDQFNCSPKSNSSNQNNQVEGHFAKISNIEYQSYIGDNFLMEASQNYITDHRGREYYQNEHHHHHMQQASFMQPQENNELIINKSNYIKNMGVIKQMQEEQKKKVNNSMNHEKNMKKIRKMIHQNQVLNSKTHRQFLHLSRYSLESFHSESRFEDSEVVIGITESHLHEQLDTSQRQKHNNGQIFEIGHTSGDNSMMSSRVPQSSQLNSKKLINNSNHKQYSGQNNTSSRSGLVNTGNNLGTINKKNNQPIMFDFDVYILAATKIQKIFKGYLSRKFIIKYRVVKKAILLIETEYLKFKQFLVKKMKDCTNQIECSSYNIIKLVQDFEKGERFLKSQFRKKNFDQRIKVNKDKLCRVFIKFINSSSSSHSNEKLEEGKKLSAEQENLQLQKEVLKMKQYIVQQQKNYKAELEAMSQKFDELKSLHKDTIKKYIYGIQSLKKRGSNHNGLVTSSSECQEKSQSSQQTSPFQKMHVNNENDNNHIVNQQKLLKYYKESDKELTCKINNYKMQQENVVRQQQKQPHSSGNAKRTGNSADCKRQSNKSPHHAYVQKQFDALQNEAEKDLEDFESRIKKIKYEHDSQKSSSHSSIQNKMERNGNNNNNKIGSGQNGKKSQEDKQKNTIHKMTNKMNKQEYVFSNNNSASQQFNSDDFINYSKFTMNSSKNK